ncbi:MAG: hypothetical protein H6566_00030 [Lewinellaceae bacterium]|nr:hypothetical protein [Lewinellaceae bacterium]
MTAFPPIIDSLGEKNDVPIHLSRASQEIIDLIEFRLPQKGLDETIRGLFPDFLELRLKVGQWIIAGNNLEHRLIYRVEENIVYLLSCYGHYV